jgi:hypothetical protein
MSAQVVLVVVALCQAACSGRSSSTHASDPAPVNNQANGTAASTDRDTSMITDEQCTARGGKIVTEQTYEHLRGRRDPGQPVTPFRICRIPSPKNGASCAGEKDCAGGHCFCTGALARPEPRNDPKLHALDGTVANGECSDEPIPSGSWYCLVEGGKVRLDGIIVD